MFANFEVNKYELMEIYDDLFETSGKLETSNPSLKNFTEETFRSTLDLDLGFKDFNKSFELSGIGVHVKKLDTIMI